MTNLLYETLTSLMVASLVTGDFTVPGNETNRFNCTLKVDDTYYEDLSTLVSGATVKLIEMSLRLENQHSSFLRRRLKGVYKPYHWVRTTGREGQSLLMLEENYDLMSLSALSIGVVSMSVNVSDHPRDCLQQLPPNDIMLLIRNSFLSGFSDSAPPSSAFGENEHICNMHVLEDNGHASFRYQCCHSSKVGDIVCKDMKEIGWIKALLVMILIMKIVVLLHSPMFLPESLYRQKYGACQYIYRLPGEPLPVNIVVTQDPQLYGDGYENKTVRLSEMHHMEYFKTLVSTSSWRLDRVYEVKVKDIRLSVKVRRLLDRSQVPVGILTQLYNSFIRCRIRRLEALKACCSSSILGRFTPTGVKIMKWSQCIRLFATVCLLIIIALPWCLRLMVYSFYEYDMLHERQETAADVGLTLSFTGSLVLYLNPLHTVFIVIYALIVVDILVFGVLAKKMKEKVNLVMRQCLRDMRERSRTAVCSWITKLTVAPFSLFGLIGFIVFPGYVLLLAIVALPIIAFYIFPTINLSVRLIIHLFIFMCPRRITSHLNRWSDQLTGLKERLLMHEVTAKESFINRHQYTTGGVLLQLVAIVMCFLSFWSITLLLMEIISFFVEVMVYTFMGIVVNAGVTLQYCTVSFLLFLYSKNTFSRVHVIYQEYHSLIHDQILAMKKEEIDAVAKLDVSEQQNTAFRVKGDMTSLASRLDKPVLRIKNNIPQWLSSGILMFLDRYDTPYTPEKFFSTTINLDYFGCPGRVYVNVLRAFWDFAKIVLFLLFIFIIVMAFGDAYQISSTNQLLATVVGGIVPFFFRNFLQSNTAVSGFDTSSVQFKTEFHTAINQFEQAWDVYDIVPVGFRDVDSGPTDWTIPHGDQSYEIVQDTFDVTSYNGIGDHSKESNQPSVCYNEKNPDIEKGSNSMTGFKSFYSEPLLKTPSRSFADSLDDEPNIDIIVDVSTSKIRRNTAIAKSKGSETGSVSMLDWNAGQKGRNFKYTLNSSSPTHHAEHIV